MDEIEARRRARQLVADAGAGTPGDYSGYLRKARARLQRESLGEGESSHTLVTPKGHVITVNLRDTEERQNHAICHELARIDLGLPSSHDATAPWAEVRQDENERLCEAYAVELLMPAAAFQAQMPVAAPSAAVIDELARAFHVSFPAAAMRYACLASFPCAGVAMSGGWIRLAGRSASLRGLKARILLPAAIPRGSVAHRLRQARRNGVASAEVAPDLWFQGWPQGAMLLELARHDAEDDATIALLCLAADKASPAGDAGGSGAASERLRRQFTSG